jgi:hypothetical protein
MSPHQAIAVGVRLFAVWLAIYWFQDIVTFYFDSTSRAYSHALTIGAAVSLFVAVLVLTLWFFPRTVARKLLAASTPESTASAPPETWLAVGCALIGFWVLTHAVPALMRNLLFLYFSDPPYHDTTNGRIWLFYFSAEIVIALWLIFGTKGLRKLFLWAQTAGQNPAKSEESAERPAP